MCGLGNLETCGVADRRLDVHVTLCKLPGLMAERSENVRKYSTRFLVRFVLSKDIHPQDIVDKIFTYSGLKHLLKT